MEAPINQEENEDKTEYRFKPFHETFRLISGCLTLGLMYPNPATEKLRIILIAALVVVTSPVFYIVVFDMWVQLQQRDVYQVIRHTTILGPYLGAVLKILVKFRTRHLVQQLIEELDVDYASYNALPQRCRALAAGYIARSRRFSEQIWALAVLLVMMIFVGLALLRTLVSQLSASPARYMVHDVQLPLREYEMRLQSPYFEVVFLLMTLCATMMCFNFIAFDGLFGVLTDHACLKMDMYCLRLEDAFQSGDPEDMDQGIRRFLHEQERCFRFIKLIRDAHDFWLGMIYMSTMIQIGSLLYNVSAGNGIDLRYAVFSASCAVHAYLPCKNAANMKEMSTDTAARVYCGGWERAGAAGWRGARALPLVLARAQRPAELVAWSLITYDMELFVNIMKTSYTMFTLLESN